ncbi:Nucleoporin nup57 [Cryomyces antarcticus]|uniref:Nucleoporin nup57 n=1 Tax=Cryomyces antarcticus TaxID=329879 RepID=A0ABR0KUK3_9PEZI|nr:Nucleoporin nup57 [Cryomyces antarcticus]
MSVFGATLNPPPQQQQQTPSPFASLNANNNTQQSKPSLFAGFGGNTSTSPFGSLSANNNAQQSKPSPFAGFGNNTSTSPFGSLSANNNTQQSKPSLFAGFGNNTSTSQPQQQSTGLFGSVGQQNQQSTTPGLFGAPTQQPQQSTGLFGASTQQPQQQQGSGLFGASAPQPQQSTGLFGASTQQPQQTSGLFGAPAQQAQQNTGLFGSSLQPQQNQQQQQGLFGASTQNQQPLGNSFLGGSQQQQQQQPLQQSRLGWNPGSIVSPREKSIPEQMELLLRKWSPETPDCLFQHYFYNNVPPERVPYYTPGPQEDPAKWEEALSKKPAEGSIPVLGKGFAQIGHRLGQQVQAVTALQMRLHEINNSLSAMMQNHSLVIGVRMAAAGRRHRALSQRCLALATKVQVLRNRGYAMDGAEEALKKKLHLLERAACDPLFAGREQEIWARMVGINERARLLQEESERLGKGVSTGANGQPVIDEVVVQKILNDYESQLAHLSKELEQIGKEYEEWSAVTKPADSGR